MVELGVFLQVLNNGWIVSTVAPQYHPTYAMHKAMTLLGDCCCYPSHIPSGSMTIPAETLERYNVPYRNS